MQLDILSVKAGSWILHETPIYQVMIPAVMPILFFFIASTPVEVLGRRTRGLLALAIAFVSGMEALGTAVILESTAGFEPPIS